MTKNYLLYMFLLFSACCKKDVEPANTDEVLIVVEQQAEFNGGQGELFKFLESNMKFPILPFNSTSPIKCVIRMVINREGKVEKPEILSSSGFPDFDEDALRVIKLSPDWLPGKSGGKFVNSYFTIPVRYNK